MSWSAESIALAATGGLLILVVIASLHSRVALSDTSRVIFFAGGLVFLGYAVLAENALRVDLPPVVLLLPLLPVAVIAMVVQHALAARRAASDGDSSVFMMPTAPFGAEGRGAERLLAASPYATPTELSELAYTHPELRPTIAGNPSAPSSLLQWLTEQGEPAVLAAISARGRIAG